MKFRKMLGSYLLAAGLGTLLLLASSAKAQEITNTEFDDGPYVVPFSQPLSDPVYTDTEPASMPALTESQALQAMALVGRPAIPEQMSLVQSAVVVRWITAVLLVAVGILAMIIFVELSMLVELRRRRALRSVSRFIGPQPFTAQGKHAAPHARTIAPDLGNL